MRKIVAISDLHGNLIDIDKEGDILIISGDICPSFDHSLTFQKKWIESSFRAWVESLYNNFNSIVFIAGNHDFIFQAGIKIDWNERVQYICDEMLDVDGISIYGTPWTSIFHDWAFMLDDDQLDGKFEMIPENLDILVTHGPAYGMSDTVLQYSSRSKEKLGSRSLKKHILRAKPRCHIFGHIHSGNHKEDILIHKDGKYTKFVNVSILDERYEVTYNPFVFIMEANKK